MTDVSSRNDVSSKIENPMLGGLMPLIGIVFLGFLAIGAPLPVFSLYLHDELGFGGIAVGLAIGLQSLVTVMSRHRAGGLVDRHGPKTAVLLGLPLAAMSGCCYLASTISGLPTEARVAILMAGRILAGFGESLFLTGTMSWGIGRIGVARTGRVMSWQGIALYAAFGLGASLGLSVYAAAGFAGVSGIAIVAPLLAFVIALVLSPVAATGGDRTPFYRVLRLIWLPGAVLALATVPFASMSAFLPLVFAARNWSYAGIAIAAFGAAYVLVRLIGSHLPDRYGAAMIVGVSLMVEAAGQGLLWRANDPVTAICASALTGAGFSLVFPAMGVLATRRVPATQRGRAVGNFIAFFDVAIALTGPVVGLAASRYGLSSVFIAGFVATLASAALVPAIRRITPTD